MGVAKPRPWAYVEELERKLRLAELRFPGNPLKGAATADARRDQALELLGYGWSNRRIAEHFGISLADARRLTL